MTPSCSWKSRSRFTGHSERGAVFDLALIERAPGWALLRVAGAKAAALFAHEAGGHRWQRVPPTERHDRVHTSTITVAVLPITNQSYSFDPRDVEWQATCGSGPGGQHRNKNQTAVQLWHRPSGLRVRCETERSQSQNRTVALALLEMRLRQRAERDHAGQRNQQRREQIGTGQRGDKIRTIRTDGVVDHRTGRRWAYREYIRGQLE